MTNTPTASPRSSRPAWLTARLITALVLTALVLVFVFTNQSTVQVQILVWSVDSPLWALILVMLAVGIVIGSLFRWLTSRKKG